MSTLIAGSKPACSSVNIYQQVSEWARQANAVNLAQGMPEPLFDEQIAAALIEGFRFGWQYTPVEGDLQLREKIAAYHGFSESVAAHTIITSGCTESLFCALVAVREEFGSRVCFIEPYYSYYPGLAQLAGLDWDILKLNPNPRQDALDIDLLASKRADGCRIFLLNAPHNPSGWVPSKQAVDQLIGFCEYNDSIIILDSVYERFIYDSASRSALQCLIAARHVCLIAGSVSKLFAAPSLRLGWLIAPDRLVAAALQVHMHSSNCQSRPAQSAIMKLFDECSGERLMHVESHYRQKRDYLAQIISKLGFTYQLPKGGHFILGRYDARYGATLPYAQRLIAETKIAALPMRDFYKGEAPAELRFSFAVSWADLAQANLNAGVMSHVS